MKQRKSTMGEIIAALWVIACLFWFSAEAPTLLTIDESSSTHRLELTLGTEDEAVTPDGFWVAASSATVAGAERKRLRRVERQK